MRYRCRFGAYQNEHERRDRRVLLDGISMEIACKTCILWVMIQRPCASRWVFGGRAFDVIGSNGAETTVCVFQVSEEKYDRGFVWKRFDLKIIRFRVVRGEETVKNQ